jgi:hypothetical protein
MHDELLTRVPNHFFTAQWCRHVCYPVLAKQIARADKKMHAALWSVAQVVLRLEAADMG